MVGSSGWGVVASYTYWRFGRGPHEAHNTSQNTEVWMVNMRREGVVICCDHFWGCRNLTSVHFCWGAASIDTKERNRKELCQHQCCICQCGLIWIYFLFGGVQLGVGAQTGFPSCAGDKTSLTLGRCCKPCEIILCFQRFTFGG